MQNLLSKPKLPVDALGLEEACGKAIFSPILFNIALNNEVIKKIEWGDKGINIDGEYLSHLLYADDLNLFIFRQRTPKYVKRHQYRKQ